MDQSRTAQPLAAEGLEWVQTCQFDAGHLTSDGGLAWVQQADATLGLCAALAVQIPDWRLWVWKSASRLPGPIAMAV